MSTRIDVRIPDHNDRVPTPPPIPPACPNCRQGVLWKDTRADQKDSGKNHWRWWCGNCQKRFRPTEEHLRRFA